jgi:hypothetical protein
VGPYFDVLGKSGGKATDDHRTIDGFTLIRHERSPRIQAVSNRMSFMAFGNAEVR